MASLFGCRLGFLHRAACSLPLRSTSREGPAQSWRFYSAKKATLEEKRARALLGGGQKRIDKQHANVSKKEGMLVEQWGMHDPLCEYRVCPLSLTSRPWLETNATLHARGQGGAGEGYITASFLKYPFCSPGQADCQGASGTAAGRGLLQRVRYVCGAHMHRFRHGRPIQKGRY